MASRVTTKLPNLRAIIDSKREVLEKLALAVSVIDNQTLSVILRPVHIKARNTYCLGYLTAQLSANSTITCSVWISHSPHCGRLPYDYKHPQGGCRGSSPLGNQSYIKSHLYTSPEVLIADIYAWASAYNPQDHVASITRWPRAVLGKRKRTSKGGLKPPTTGPSSRKRVAPTKSLPEGR